MSAESQKTADALATLRIPRDEEPRRNSLFRRATGWIIICLVICLLGVGGVVLARSYGWLASLDEYVPEAIRSIPEVRVTTVVVEKGRSADAVVVATGYLESRRQAKIGARAAGRIEVVNVEEGSRVKVGDVIAVLEHRDVEAALAATKAAVDRARADLAEQQVEIARTRNEYDRAAKLRANGGNSEADLDAAKFAYQSATAKNNSLKTSIVLAEARVQETEQFKENMIIRAPFDGTVISKDAEVGESILPGGMGEASGRGNVVTIADLEHLEVDCDVKEDYISRVIQGAPAEVVVDAVPERRFKGRVRKIIPMGDRARATIKVKVEILDANERLFPDMSGTVYFLSADNAKESVDEKPRTFCDNAAILSDETGHFAWQLDDNNRTMRVALSLGDKRNDRTEILRGLVGGERVILNPTNEIDQGMLVKISE